MPALRATATARPTVARRGARVVASAQKPNLAQAAVAAVTAVMLIAQPAFAEKDVVDTIRPVLCASNPTSKACLKDSYIRQQQASEQK